MYVTLHPVWHLVISTIFFWEACSLVAYFFAGYNISKKRGEDVKGWLLYGGLIAIALLIISAMDLYFGLSMLDYTYAANVMMGPVSVSKLFKGGVVGFLSVGILMFSLAGHALGQSHFAVPEASTLPPGSQAETDAKEWSVSAKRWVQYGIGVGCSISLFALIFIYSKGTREANANIASNLSSSWNKAKESMSSSWSNAKQSMSNSWKNLFTGSSQNQDTEAAQKFADTLKTSPSALPSAPPAPSV